MGGRNCTFESVPGNIPVSNDSVAVAVMGKEESDFRAPTEVQEQNMKDFVYYDRHVRQAIPWLIMLQSEARSGALVNEMQMVCVAPENVTEGSRVPKGPWPPESEEDNNDDSDDKNEDNKSGENSENNENSARVLIGDGLLVWVLGFSGVVAALMV